MFRAVVLPLLLLLADDGPPTAPDPGPEDPALSDLDRRILPAMPGLLESGPLLVHYDPRALTAGKAEREAGRALEALRLLETNLDLRVGGRIHLFLHRNEEAFHAATGAPEAWTAFASGASVLHLPCGAPVVHEMTHVVARAIPGGADRDPGGLLREGLAVAMEGEERGVPVTAWAAVYARVGLLPSLVDLRRRWPEEPPRIAHPYLAAGAFVRRLLDTAGPGKVKALYADPGRVTEILGRGWDVLDREWREWLLAVAIPPEQEERVRHAIGLPVGLLPEPMRGTPGNRILDAGARPGWIERRPGAWTAPAGASPAEGFLRGGSTTGWAVMESAREFSAGTALRVRARVLGSASLLLRMDSRDGASDDALLTPEGSLLTLAAGQGDFARSEVRLVPGRWTDIHLVEDRGTARLYLDGRLVLEASGAFRGGGGAVGIGVSAGTAEVDFAEVIPCPAPSAGSSMPGAPPPPRDPPK